MANAIWSKDGESFFETDDTPEYQEQAKSKNYTRYYDITKDDTNVYRVTADRLEEAKGKGYKIFGQPAIEQKPVTPAQIQKPVEEPSLLDQAGQWLGRTAEAGVEAVKGAPAGLYQLGKEVVTQPAEAIPAALTGAGKTFGLAPIGGALRGGYEAGKALFTGEEVEPAFKRGYEAEISGLEERAKRAKEVSPAAYATGPYAATAIAAGATGGASLPVMAILETATGAAQQLAEKGEIDTAELTGQTIGGGALMGAPAAVSKVTRAVEGVSPFPLTKTGREAKAGKLEQAAITKAEEVGGIGDVAKEYIGEEGTTKIREAKRAGYDVGQAKSKYKVLKSQLDNEFNTKVYEIDQRNAKLEADYTTEKAKRAAEYNDLIGKVDQERQRIGKVNEDLLADYNTKLEAHNQETARLEQQYQDAKQKYTIEKTEYTRQTQEKAKQLDQEYLGKKEAYETEDLPKWQETRQQELAANEKAKQDYRLQVAEWQANTKKAVNDLKAESRKNYIEIVKKAKQAFKSLKGESVTAMGDELRGMLDNMDKVQEDAYTARKNMALADENIVERVEDSATSKAISDIEQTLSSNYILDDAVREELKTIKAKVNPEFQTQPINRGKDFEALLELRQYLDNTNNDLRLEARSIQRQGGSVPVKLTNKRKAIYEARQKIQSSLYGSNSVFSPELRSLGEAADNIYSEFRRAKGTLQQRGVLAKEKAVPGMESKLEPKTNLIEDYFDELDASRKNETKQLLQELGINIDRLNLLEEQVKRGIVPEHIAVDQLKLPERPVFTYQPQFTPKPIRPSKPMGSQYIIDAQQPTTPLKPVFPTAPIKPVRQPLPQRPVFEAPAKPIYEATPRKRIMGPEEMELKGSVAEKEALAQEYKALGGKSTFDEQGLPTTETGVISRGLEYVGEKAGIGLTPMQLLEKAAEVRGSRSLIEKVQAAFPDNPSLNIFIKSVVNTGTKITPALVRAAARKSNVDEEKLAKTIVESQTP